ncbi:hypothetical protein GCM10009844_23590 [Nocardioides koreensis]|uniref:LysM domain-containing protein n=1 Tax=Nocardioides koreensis TaxID=433651 RepID=A0ABP5LGQ6_9ACTN
MSTMTASTTFRPTLAPASAGQLRLTRRGRLVVLALAMLVALGLGLALAAGSVATEEPGTPEPTRVVMVGAGDTLWGIAADIADDGGVRTMIDRIERLNALDSGMVVAGQRLRVPVE